MQVCSGSAKVEKAVEVSSGCYKDGGAGWGHLQTFVLSLFERLEVQGHGAIRVGFC